MAVKIVKDTILRDMNKAVRQIKGRTLRGVLRAAQLIRRRAVQMTPVDTGNLRSGSYVDGVVVPHFGPMAEVGFTAAYAPFVHEINKNYVTGQWKFLQTALHESQKDVLRVIREESRI
jgi:hypothetical protein